MKIMNLGQVATFINGYPFKPTQWAFEGIPIIRIQDLTGSQNNIHYFKGAIDKKYYVNQDDILISWSGTLGVHKWLGNQAVLNQHIFKVVFDKNIEIDRDYFERQIAFILKNAEDQAHGATMKHLTKKVFDSLTFKWVSITEQIYISNILNCLEKIIIRKNKQIDYLEEAVKSRFIEMFGSSKKEMVDKWETRQLISCVESIESGKSLVCNTFPQQNNEPAILKLSSISSGHFLPGENKSMVDSSNLDRSKLVSKGDILLTRKNTPELVGLNVLVNQDTQNLMFPDIIFRMHPKSSIKGEYLSMLLMTKDFLSEIQAISHGSSKSMSNIPKSKLAEVIIPLPPILLQHHFIEQKLLIDKSKLAIQKSIDELETLKKSLMQEYFG